LRPNDLIAVRGLAGTELKLGDKAATLPLFERLTKAEPNSATNWRGQFEAKAAKDAPPTHPPDESPPAAPPNIS